MTFSGPALALTLTGLVDQQLAEQSLEAGRGFLLGERAGP